MIDFGDDCFIINSYHKLTSQDQITQNVARKSLVSHEMSLDGMSVDIFNSYTIILMSLVKPAHHTCSLMDVIS